MNWTMGVYSPEVWGFRTLVVPFGGVPVMRNPIYSGL